LAGQSDFTLYHGDPRRLFLQAVALMLIQQNNLIDLTGKGNLLRYAGDATIEDLGWLYGPRADRLPPSHAVTTIEFSLAVALSTVLTVPAGTRVIAAEFTFATLLPLDIPAGEVTGQVMAMRDVPGPEGNGLVPGQVFQIIDRVPFVEGAVNVTESAGGANVEGLEAYRTRVRNTPESFSTAGPDGAYWFWAKTANPGIIDVDVWMPELDDQVFVDFVKEILQSAAETEMGVGYGGGLYGGTPILIGDESENQAEYWYKRFMEILRDSGTGPGHVNVVPLMEGGEIPTQDILDAVYDICNAKYRRPLTDFLHVLPPVPVAYSLELTYWIDMARSVDAVAIQAAVAQAVEDYIAWQCAELGRAIIPDVLIRFVMEAGARRVKVDSPIYTQLRLGEVARLTDATVTYGGLEKRP
jgi:phage-related baseplate assembly protein